MIAQPIRGLQLCRGSARGDGPRAEELLPLVYEELRVIAGVRFARRPEVHTLQATSVVHEAWLKLAGQKEGWEGRSHFLAVAARAMRQVLADHARAKRAAQRGGGWRKLSFDDRLGEENRAHDLVDVDDALTRLSEANERPAPSPDRACHRG